MFEYLSGTFVFKFIKIHINDRTVQITVDVRKIALIWSFKNENNILDLKDEKQIVQIFIRCITFFSVILKICIFGYLKPFVR